MKPFFFLQLCVFLLCFVSCNGNPEDKQVKKDTPAKEVRSEIIKVPEMTPVGVEYKKSVSSISSTKEAEFAAQWESMMNWVESQITSEMLLDISRWAKPNMKEFTLPQGWIQKLPMHALSSSEDDRYILFFQTTEQGFPVPSHHPIVFRRLGLAAVYDTRTKTIPKIYVTIRGWKEE